MIDAAVDAFDICNQRTAPELTLSAAFAFARMPGIVASSVANWAVSGTPLSCLPARNCAMFTNE